MLSHPSVSPGCPEPRGHPRGQARHPSQVGAPPRPGSPPTALGARSCPPSGAGTPVPCARAHLDTWPCGCMMPQPCQALGTPNPPEPRPRGHQACHPSRDPSLGSRGAEGLSPPSTSLSPAPQSSQYVRGGRMSSSQPGPPRPSRVGSDLGSGRPGGWGGDWGVTPAFGGHSWAGVMLGPVSAVGLGMCVRGCSSSSASLLYPPSPASRPGRGWCPPKPAR